MRPSRAPNASWISELEPGSGPSRWVRRIRRHVIGGSEWLTDTITGDKFEKCEVRAFNPAFRSLTELRY